MTTNSRFALARDSKVTKSRLVWRRPGEPLPANLILQAAGLDPIIISFGGGNKGLTPELKAVMPGWFSKVFKGLKGTAISGGTGHFDDDRQVSSFEITQVPSLLASENPCCAIGFTPLTSEPTLDHHHGSVGTDKYGGELDPRQDANVVIQAKPSDEFLGWDGDLAVRFQLFEELLEQDYTVAVVLFNGGDVTTDEIYRGLQLTRKGGKVFVVEGSGREADKFIKLFRDGVIDDTNANGKPLDAALASARHEILGRAKKENVFILPFADADASREIVVAQGLVS